MYKALTFSFVVGLVLNVMLRLSTKILNRGPFRGKVWFNQILTRYPATAIIRQSNYIDCTKWYDGSWNSLKASMCTVHVLKF